MTATAATALEHRYRPLGSARELFGCRDGEVLLSGAAGTGKSRACLEKVHAMCLANPGMRALVVRKTATSLTSTGLVTFREIVAREALASGELRFYGGSRQEAASYKYANKSVINVGGMDKSTRIMSSEYDICYVQEATELTLEDWETITTRLRNGKVSFQQLLADCNPGPPHHWLKQRADSGRVSLIYCRHEDNPRLYEPGVGWTTEGLAYIERLEGLTGVRYQRLRLGKWAAAEGLVYDTFDPAIHFHKPLGLPPADWPRYLSVDFGYTNPMCVQWWVEDPDGRLHLYKELYKTRTLVEDMAAAIIQAARKGDGHRPDVWPPRAVICDHDAEDRATLERHLEISTIPAIKSVSDGIQAVQSRLKIREDGKPGLFLRRDAVVSPDLALREAHRPSSTAEEVLEYIWDPTATPRGAGGLREAPLKANDHGMDAMRYLVAHIDLGPRPRYRSFTVR